MKDLKKMCDEEFCNVIEPPIDRLSSTTVTISEDGRCYLNGKLAGALHGKGVQLAFNKDFTVLQLLQVDDGVPEKRNEKNPCARRKAARKSYRNAGKI